MDPTFHYIREKLFLSILTFCKSPGDVRSRLKLAYYHFHVLRPDDFPEDFQKEWAEILDSLTKYGPKIGFDGKPYMGGLDHTLKRMRNSTGSKIAEKIFELYYQMHFNEKYL